MRKTYLACADRALPSPSRITKAARETCLKVSSSLKMRGFCSVEVSCSAECMLRSEWNLLLKCCGLCGSNMPLPLLTALVGLQRLVAPKRL